MYTIFYQPKISQYGNDNSYLCTIFLKLIFIKFYTCYTKYENFVLLKGRESGGRCSKVVMEFDCYTGNGGLIPTQLTVIHFASE